MRAISTLVVSAGLLAAAAPLASSSKRDSPSLPSFPAGYDVVPLGRVRVTNYTHHECGSRVTSSGHVLKDSDAGRVCAVSRDWWRSKVKPGDLIWVVGYAEPCVALDTMALANRNGFPQRQWIDIYRTDRKKALDFGIRRSAAYLLKKRKA